MSAIWSAFSRWYFNKLTSRLSKLGSSPLRLPVHGDAQFAHFQWPTTPQCALPLCPRARAGLQYHDVIADTGVHELAVSRLPAAAQVRTRDGGHHPAGRRCNCSGGADACVRRHLTHRLQIERTRRIKRAIDLSAKHEDIPVAARVSATQACFGELHGAPGDRASGECTCNDTRGGALGGRSWLGNRGGAAAAPQRLRSGTGATAAAAAWLPHAWTFMAASRLCHP